MKRFLLTLCVMMGLAGVDAQTMKDFFVAMPDSLQPLLTKDNRLDMIDFKKSSMKAEVTNRLGGKTELTDLTDDYLKMQLSVSSGCEMKLLPIGKSSVICVVKTVKAVVEESVVTFYSTEWKRLDAAKFLKFPTLSDFWKKPSVSSKESDEKHAMETAVPYVEAHFRADSDNLVMKLNLDEISEEDRKDLHEELTFEWRDGRFRAQ